MNIHRLLNASYDCVARFRSSQFPLKNVASDIIKSRKLNSTDRKALLDLVFRFGREINLFDRFLDTTTAHAQTLTRQQRDILALDLFSYILFAQSSKDFLALKNTYEQWLIKIGDERSLFALGELLSSFFIAQSDKASAVNLALGLDKRAPKYLAFEKPVTFEHVKQALEDVGIEYFTHSLMPEVIGCHESINFDRLPKALVKHLWVMDVGSQLIASLIRPKPENRVLDLCVGEGNKARLISKHSCHYVAVDNDAGRLAIAKKRLFEKNMHFMAADGRKLEGVKDSFDWILLDAPCSGTGLLSRHPDLIHRLSKKDIDHYVALQKELLRSAVTYLKPGGVLVYATCSLLAVENQQQIQTLLKENKQITPVLLRDLVLSEVQFKEEVLNNFSLTLYPHMYNCDGFYFACLSKKPLP